jgi:hypothetical protein
MLTARRASSGPPPTCTRPSHCGIARALHHDEADSASAEVAREVLSERRLLGAIDQLVGGREAWVIIIGRRLSLERARCLW